LYLSHGFQELGTVSSERGETRASSGTSSEACVMIHMSLKLMTEVNQVEHVCPEKGG